MLNICTDTLPQSTLSYAAFRIAFQETLERIALANQMGEDSAGCFGFLLEVPFLDGVPPHIQLDLLAETWRRHVDDQPVEASLVDESVLYAACETSARLIEQQPSMIRRYMRGGPAPVPQEINRRLAARIRDLHLTLSNDGDFLMISQFLDMDPDDADALKEEWGVDKDRLESMFDVLSRWAMSPEFLSNLSGLLTKREVIRTVNILGVQ